MSPPAAAARNKAVISAPSAREASNRGRPSSMRRRARVNGQPGLLAWDADGDLIVVIALDVLDGQIQAIRVIANPDKLRHLGPVSRTWHLRWNEPDSPDGGVTPAEGAAS